MNYLQPGQADLSTDTNIDFFDPKLKPATRRFTIRASFAFAVKSFCCPRCPKKCKRHRWSADTVRIVIDTHHFTKARRQVNDFHRRGRFCWTDWNNGCQKEKLHNNLLFPIRKMMINCLGLIFFISDVTILVVFLYCPSVASQNVMNWSYSFCVLFVRERSSFPFSGQYLSIFAALIKFWIKLCFQFWAFDRLSGGMLPTGK